MQFNVITLFPEVFEPYLSTSILGRAQDTDLVKYGVHDLRAFGEGKHNVVDDTPYGGGAGMVMKVAPIDQALRAMRKE